MKPSKIKRGSAEERRWFGAVASIPYCVLCGAYGVQVAHRNEGAGMGMKSQPYMTAALCPHCHNEIDNGTGLDKAERRARMDKAIVLTHAGLIKSGSMGLLS